MSDFELIFFAAIAGFFIYKLWSVLGKTNGDEQARGAELAAIIEQQKQVRAKKPEGKAGEPVLKLVEKAAEPVVEEFPARFAAELRAIKQIDEGFSLKTFLSGAELAFEGVFAAYNDAKKNRLEFLLSNSVYQNFVAELDANEKAGRKAHVTLVSVDEPKIEAVELSGKMARVSLRFNSEQINFTTDAESEVVEGSKTYIDRSSDIWVFERDLASAKPQWLIVATNA